MMGHKDGVSGGRARFDRHRHRPESDRACDRNSRCDRNRVGEGSAKPASRPMDRVE